MAGVAGNQAGEFHVAVAREHQPAGAVAGDARAGAGVFLHDDADAGNRLGDEHAAAAVVVEAHAGHFAAGFGGTGTREMQAVAGIVGAVAILQFQAQAVGGGGRRPRNSVAGVALDHARKLNIEVAFDDHSAAGIALDMGGFRVFFHDDPDAGDRLRGEDAGPAVVLGIHAAEDA